MQTAAENVHFENVKGNARPKSQIKYVVACGMENETEREEEHI